MHKLTVEEMHRLTVDEFRSASKLPLTVVLDNIRSLHNVGSVFRTADAFRIERLYLCGITACPPSAEIHKTALGAEDSVSWTYRPDTLAAVDELLADGYEVLLPSRSRGASVSTASNSCPDGAMPWCSAMRSRAWHRMSWTAVRPPSKFRNTARSIRSTYRSAQESSCGKCVRKWPFRHRPSPEKS